MARDNAFFSKVDPGLNFCWHSDTNFFFFSFSPLRGKGRKEKEVSNREKEKWQFHWDKSEEILLPSSKSKGMLSTGPALGNEWAKCPDEDLSAGSWKGQNYHDTFEDSLEKQVKVVDK